MLPVSLIAESIDRHAANLTLFARGWCLSAEDVTASVFGKFARLTEAPYDPAAWLYKVVRRAAIDAGKAERRRAKRERAAAKPEVWFAESASQELEAEEAIVALQGLPDDQRDVIVARLWGDLTLKQIAAVVGCSVSTAHRRYETGLVALRERLGAAWPTISSNR